MSDYDEILNSVFCAVFEQMAFMFGDPVEPDDCESSANRFIRVYMTFSGDRDGSVEMLIERDMCSVIASNVLGIDPDDDKAHSFGIDSVKEMLNVICGQTLTEIAGEEPVFNLSVPQVEEIKAKHWKKYIGSGKFNCFDVDDHPAGCKLEIK